MATHNANMSGNLGVSQNGKAWFEAPVNLYEAGDTLVQEIHSPKRGRKPASQKKITFVVESVGKNYYREKPGPKHDHWVAQSELVCRYYGQCTTEKTHG